MRKALSFILAAVLFLSLFPVAASAATPELTTTKHFIDYLEAKSVKYTYKGWDNDNKDERVEVTYTLDNFESVKCVIFFRNNNHTVSLRIWDILTASAGKNYVLTNLNSLNYDYKYAKFVLDEQDNTVQAEMDMYVDQDHCAECVYDAMHILLEIIDDEEVAKKLHSLE